MALEFSTIKREIKLAIGDGIDSDKDPDLLDVEGRVTFTPVLEWGGSVQVVSSENSYTVALHPVVSEIEQGKLSYGGDESLKLPAGGEGCNPPIIRWKAVFSRMRAGDYSFALSPVIFDAVPSGEIDLTLLAPVANEPEGIIRGPAGTSLSKITVEGSSLLFTAKDESGEFVMATIPLDSVVRAEAEEAGRLAAEKATNDAKEVLDSKVQVATDKAKESTDSAANAKTSETNASTKAGEASTSASNAKTSETNAKTSETNAAADRVQTGKDRTATGSDRTATAEDRTAAAASAGTATTQADRAKDEADRSTTQAGLAKTEADRAAEAAELADGAAVQAVTERVDTLLEGAPEAYDTLREVSEKLAAQDDVASALTSQIGTKASKQELADGLAGKANASHTHTTAQVTGLDTDLAGKASMQALTDGLATRVEGGSAVKKIEVVTAIPAAPVATTLYLVVS